MQQTGTLRKRRRRNLAKVNGLSIIQYEEENDTFTGSDLFRYDENVAGHFRQSQRPSAVPKSSLRNASGENIDLEAGLGNIGKGNTSANVGGNGRDGGGVSRNEISGRRPSAFGSARNRVTRNPNFPAAHHASAEGELGELSHENLTQDQIPDMRDLTGSVFEVRSHFIKPTVMRRLKTLIFLGAISGAFPWKWNQKTYCIEKWSPFWEQLWWLQWFLITIQTAFLLCFQIYVFFDSFQTDVVRTNREIFMSCFNIFWYMYGLGYNLNLFLFKEKIRNYINTMLRFNHDYVRKYLVHLDDFKDRGGPVMLNVFFGTMCEIISSASFFIRMPYMPWYVFSYIYPKPWYWIIPGTLQDMTMIGQACISFLLLAWVIVCHTNTLQFWLREIHNNKDSDYTIDELRRPRNALATYKILQVLNTQMNECMSPLGIYMQKFVWISALVPCGYVMVRSMNHLFLDEFPGILLYVLSIHDCGVMSFQLITLAAEVYDLGCSFIDSWSLTKQKDFRRILMSCPTLKIWAGREYFMTVSTTITFMKVVFDMITDCIIAFP